MLGQAAVTVVDELITWLRAQLDVRESLLLHTQASDTPCPAPIRTLLAEVEAKRRILDAYERAVQRQAENSAKFVRMTDGRYSNDPDYVAVKTHGWELKGQVDALRVAVTELVQPYAGQPGWREEWRLEPAR